MNEEEGGSSASSQLDGGWKEEEEPTKDKFIKTTMEEKKGVKETVNEILEANGIQLQKRLSTTQAMDLIKNLSHMIMWRTTSGGSNLGQEIKNMNETFQIDDLQTMQKLGKRVCCKRYIFYRRKEKS